VQSLSGDSWEDTCDLLCTLYLVICLMFAGKQSPAATEMLNRTGALASGFAAHFAWRIVKSVVCCVCPQLDAVLNKATVRSFLTATSSSTSSPTARRSLRSLSATLRRVRAPGRTWGHPVNLTQPTQHNQGP
jgi:hypothetical protein